MMYAFNTGAPGAAATPAERGGAARTRAAPRHPRLLTVPLLPGSAFARFVLDHQAMAHEETPHLAIVARLLALVRSGGMALPLLSGPEGHVAGLRRILDWSEARCPVDRRLMPGDAAERAEVEALCASAGSDLAAAVTACLWAHVPPRRGRMVERLTRGMPGWEYVLARLLPPVFGAGRLPTRAAALADIRSGFAAIDARLADGRDYLVGGRLTLADIAVATAAAPLLLPAGHDAPILRLEEMPPALLDLVGELHRRPTAALVQRVFKQRRARA